MMMLAPDLLDRRALALLRLIDVHGRPVAGPVRIESEGVRTVAKASGRFAVLAAPGFEAHVAAFLAPPAAPALQSRQVAIDLTPAARDVAPRRFNLRLPRDPATANAGQAGSLYQPVDIEMLPSPRARTSGSACAVRVTVRREDDQTLVANALVRARSDNGQFTARAVTDARGEACLVFPVLPLAFPGEGAAVQPDIAARVVATVDPAIARFHTAAESAAALEADAMRTADHPDPDSIGVEAADFEEGVEVRLSAGREPGVVIEWEQP